MSCTLYLKEDEMKIAMEKSLGYHGNHKKFLRVCMILGDAVSKLRTFVWILNPLSRSITWYLFILKASYLVKWPTSTWSFMWWCQFIRLVKIWNTPQFPNEFQNDQFYSKIEEWRGRKRRKWMLERDTPTLQSSMR